MKPIGGYLKGTIAMLGLALLLTFLNFFFILQNRRLVKKMETAPALGIASVGSRLPILAGRSPSGKSLTVNTASSRAVLILLFSPSCRYCDKNWPRWDQLLRHPPVKSEVLFVSTTAVPSSYALEHHLGGLPVLTTLRSTTQNEFGMNATPQTILVKGGIVTRNWPGPLKPVDVDAIRTTLAKANQ